MSLQDFPPASPFLLVEDDLDDQRLLRRAVEAAKPRVAMEVVDGVASAVEYLLRHRPFAVLSDVHMPLGNGFELLAWIRGRAGLDRLPVLLWTSLPNPEGAHKAAGLGAARYVAKPSDLAGYRRVAAMIATYLGD